jgi:probable DNA metabolism protein
MTILVYDNTFAGFLTCIFEAYERKLPQVEIVKESENRSYLFDEVVKVSTDETKVQRVFNGIKKYASADVGMELYRVFLSEQLEAEKIMLQYLRALFDERKNISEDYTRDYVLKVHQIDKQMRREIHRMHAFVRFEKTSDNVYFSSIEPDFNVLPLAIEHFEKRYADQQWIIYDLKRKYGYFYDLQQVTEIVLDLSPQESPIAPEPKESLYQLLWKSYFDSVNIPERKNMKLHIRHVPKRYWKYLPEKYL